MRRRREYVRQWNDDMVATARETLRHDRSIVRSLGDTFAALGRAVQAITHTHSR